MNRSGFVQPRFTILRLGLARRGIKPGGRGHSAADFRHCLVRSKERFRLVREMPKHDRAVHVVEGGSLRAPNEPVGFRRRGPRSVRAARKRMRQVDFSGEEGFGQPRESFASATAARSRVSSCCEVSRSSRSTAASNPARRAVSAKASAVRIRDCSTASEAFAASEFATMANQWSNASKAVVSGFHPKFMKSSPRLVEKGPLEASARVFP